MGLKNNSRFEFYRKPGPFDVAILKLKTSLISNENVARVRLSENYIMPTGFGVMISGWNPSFPIDTTSKIDLKSFFKMESKMLRSFDSQLIPQNECKKIIETIPNVDGKNMKKLLHETYICTKTLNASEFSIDVS